MSEYHSVYRAKSCFRFWHHDQRRARELRYDIIRLQAWAWYLSLSVHPPWWWRLLDGLANRTYAAHMETFQGQLLTLRLAQEHYLKQNREAEQRHLEAAVTGLAEHRQCLALNAGRVTVICWTLAQVLRVRGWLMVDS